MRSLAFFSTLLFFAISPPTFAQGHEANIQQGNLSIGGSFNYSTYWISDRTLTSLNLQVPAEYFFFDHLSLGGSFAVSYSLSGGSSTTTPLLGPSGTYYFWQQKNLAAYFASAFEYQGGSAYRKAFFWSGTLGLNYFITPVVALGPSIQFEHRFGLDSTVDYNALRWLASFSLHF